MSLPPDDFAASARDFAALGAAQRAVVFSGATVAGNNLQIGATAFRAAFAANELDHETELHGVRVQVAGAVARILRSLALTFTIGTVVTHLPTARTFEVQSVVLDPLETEDKLILRRRE